jgi:hypothetical protein
VLFDETYIHVFGYVYQVRLVGKQIKAESLFACYTFKHAIVGGLLYVVFLS